MSSPRLENATKIIWSVHMCCEKTAANHYFHRIFTSPPQVLIRKSFVVSRHDPPDPTPSPKVDESLHVVSVVRDSCKTHCATHMCCEETSLSHQFFWPPRPPLESLESTKGLCHDWSLLLLLSQNPSNPVDLALVFETSPKFWLGVLMDRESTAAFTASRK
jgi:hypothetical protein